MNRAKELLQRVALARSWEKLMAGVMPAKVPSPGTTSLWKEVEDYLGKDELDEETLLFIRTRDALACLVNWTTTDAKGPPELVWVLETLDKATKVIDSKWQEPKKET